MINISLLNENVIGVYLVQVHLMRIEDVKIPLNILLLFHNGMTHCSFFCKQLILLPLFVEIMNSFFQIKRK